MADWFSPMDFVASLRSSFYRMHHVGRVLSARGQLDGSHKEGANFALRGHGASQAMGRAVTALGCLLVLAVVPLLAVR